MKLVPNPIPRRGKGGGGLPRGRAMCYLPLPHSLGRFVSLYKTRRARRSAPGAGDRGGWGLPRGRAMCSLALPHLLGRIVSLYRTCRTRRSAKCLFFSLSLSLSRTLLVAPPALPPASFLWLPSSLVSLLALPLLPPRSPATLLPPSFLPFLFFSKRK